MQHIVLIVKDGDRLLHEILAYINVYICKVGMPPSLLLTFLFDLLEWVNQAFSTFSSMWLSKQTQGLPPPPTDCTTYPLR